MYGEWGVPLCKSSGCMRETFTETQCKVKTTRFALFVHGRSMFERFWILIRIV